jgi:hypothetical protein
MVIGCIAGIAGCGMAIIAGHPLWAAIVGAGAMFLALVVALDRNRFWRDRRLHFTLYAQTAVGFGLWLGGLGGAFVGLVALVAWIALSSEYRNALGWLFARLLPARQP